MLDLNLLAMINATNNYKLYLVLQAKFYRALIELLASGSSNGKEPLLM